MTSLRFPDLSHWQGQPDWSKIGPAAIIKAAESTSVVDSQFSRNAAGAASHCTWWGAYQFLRPTDDARAAARFLAKTLGTHRPNAVFLDLEQGDGNQSGRRDAWLDEWRKTGFPAPAYWYSGLSFAAEHNLGHPDWVAAYRDTEPTGGHFLWQYSQSGSNPGIHGNCDLSLFHGTVAELVSHTAYLPVTVDLSDFQRAILHHHWLKYGRRVKRALKALGHRKINTLTARMGHAVTDAWVAEQAKHPTLTEGQLLRWVGRQSTDRRNRFGVKA